MADMLAAEFVLGTLRGPARRRFESLLPAHPALRRAVIDWELRLTPLARSLPLRAPPERVWRRIAARLAPANKQLRWWQRAAPWRLACGLATAAMLAMLLQRPETATLPAAPPVLVLLAAPAQDGAPLRFVASIGSDGQALVLRAVQAPSLQPAQDYQLWALPATGAPQPVAVLQAGLETRVPALAAPLREWRALAISLEPAGGSPTGAPTGPIVALGALTL